MARALLLSLATLLVASVTGSPLWDYVHTFDDAYSYFDTGVRLNENGSDWTGYLMNMTSQRWLTPADSSAYIWTHQLLIIVPDNLTSVNAGFLYITGGDQTSSPPGEWSEDVLVSSIMAVSSGTITATLWQIPNQPIVFPSDPEQKRRSEDAAVAWTWYMYINEKPNDPEWILYFPMTKAAVRALDTVADFAKKKHSLTIDRFVVAGASKRGWITWLTGAVDSRVIGIMPIVMDLMHMEETLMHMWKAYGGWTFAFEDYYAVNITVDVTTPKLTHLAEQIDVINYKQNLTMPKLVIDSTGDEFFMLDDDHYWWGELLGETKRLMISNAEHSMATGVLPLITGADAFYLSVIHSTPRPDVNWTLNADGSIYVVTSELPTQAVVRFATTFGDKRRDFRLIKGDTKEDPCDFIPVKIFGSACINPVLWVGEDIAMTKTSQGYEAKVTQPLPPSGWRAFFVDLYFPGPFGSTFRFTTQVSIIPNTFPFPPCSGDGCRGELV